MSSATWTKTRLAQTLSTLGSSHLSLTPSDTRLFMQTGKYCILSMVGRTATAETALEWLQSLRPFAATEATRADVGATAVGNLMSHLNI